MIPTDRVLVFTPADGWEPIFRFLDEPIPATDFPRSNAWKEFWAQFGGELVAAWSQRIVSFLQKGAEPFHFLPSITSTSARSI